MRRPSAPAVAAALLALLLGLPASGARGQIVSVDAGVLASARFADPVVELYAAAPRLGRVRPYLISSWSVGELEPVLVTQLAVSTFAKGRVWNSVDAGLTWFPFNDYRPELSASTYLGVRLPVRNVHVFSLFAVQPRMKDWSVVAGVAYTLLYRR